MASYPFGMEGENIVDPNRILMELDKGLRSGRNGDQAEAIVRFPCLLDKYPHPILINSAFLKLADVFKNGQNFSRLLILQVMQKTMHHMDKISNTDEFVRRLFLVTYSNDPVARSLTLKALGAIACIAHDRKNIHHCIRESLDSKDEIEVSAAIEAAAAYARHSKEFALNMYPKVLSMMTGLDTEPELKIKLLAILHHSHYDISLAQELCMRLELLLASNPDENFVCSVLHTLTFVCSSSLIRVHDLIELLFKFLEEDLREDVQSRAIAELTELAKWCPHFWSSNNIDHLLSELKNQKPFMLAGLLRVLSELMKCPSLLSTEEDNEKLFERVLRLVLEVITESEDIKCFSASFEILMSLYSIQSQTDIVPDILNSIQIFSSKISFITFEKTNLSEIWETLFQLSKHNNKIKSRIVKSLKAENIKNIKEREAMKNMIAQIDAINK